MGRAVQLWRLARHLEWRWIVAHAWDLIFRRSCWAETATWAMRTEGCRLRVEAAGKGTPSYCPVGVNTAVGCWCGKFRARVKS